MDNTETQNIISLCTGYGGIEIGIKRTGFPIRTVCYVEIEHFCQANLVAKIEKGQMDAAPIWTDLKTFPAELFRGKVHGVLAGFPCQPFSNAGNKMGTEDPRHLWPYIEKSIAVIRPEWVFLENVPGLISTYTIHHRPKWQRYCQQSAKRLGSEFAQRFAAKLAKHGGISALQFILWRLEQMGYNVEAGLFTAAEVGAPHKRERLFILGYSNTRRQELGQGFNYNKEWFGKEEIRESNQQSRFDSTGSELGNPNSQQGRSHTEGRDDEAETRSASESELVNSEGGRAGIGRNEISERQGPRVGRSSGTSGKDMADTISKRSKAESEPTNTGNKGQSDNIEHRVQAWPARPGQPQYAWEEPRTVKSGMGLFADGYNPRVDQLRLIGNGVVPQTAELAFRTLYERI